MCEGSQILSPGISNGGAHGTSNDGAEGPRMTAQGQTSGPTFSRLGGL